MSASHQFPELDINAEGTESKIFNIATLEISGKLQTTLDVSNLLDLFANCSQKYLTFDGFVFHGRDGFVRQWGTQTNQQGSYRLRLRETMLGEIKLYRQRPFCEEDTIMLEYLLSALLYPMRNAQLYHQAAKHAQLDALTGINNRGAFDANFDREIDLAKRHGIALSLLMIDLDNFKQVNDNLGHRAGDAVLKNVVATIIHCSRRSDLFFRYGGEEFILLLRNTTITGGSRLAERIRTQVQNTVAEFERQSIAVTVSIGVSELSQGDTAEEFFKRADSALYRAKRSGRNQIQRLESMAVNA